MVLGFDWRVVMLAHVSIMGMEGDTNRSLFGESISPLEMCGHWCAHCGAVFVHLMHILEMNLKVLEVRSDSDWFKHVQCAFINPKYTCWLLHFHGKVCEDWS